MHPPFGNDARRGADPIFVRVGPTLVIWGDWKGDLYAFCGLACQQHYEVWVCDPNYPFEKATWTEASFGCWWCGGDLTAGVAWLSEEPRAGSKAVPRRRDR